jgi:hypothetical protein
MSWPPLRTVVPPNTVDASVSPVLSSAPSRFRVAPALPVIPPLFSPEAAVVDMPPRFSVPSVTVICPRFCQPSTSMSASPVEPAPIENSPLLTN